MGIFPAMSTFLKGCRAEYFFLDVKTILNYFISIDFSSLVAKSGLVRHNLSKV